MTMRFEPVDDSLVSVKVDGQRVSLVENEEGSFLTLQSGGDGRVFHVLLDVRRGSSDERHLWNRLDTQVTVEVLDLSNVDLGPISQIFKGTLIRPYRHTYSTSGSVVEYILDVA